jgi:hypothetical protein
MLELKLARLPDRTPVKLAITVTPDLHQMLQQYAALYAEAYGREESITDLVPAMLAAFLDSDRAFSRARKTAEE